MDVHRLGQWDHLPHICLPHGDSTSLNSYLTVAFLLHLPFPFLLPPIPPLSTYLNPTLTIPIFLFNGGLRQRKIFELMHVCGF